MAARHGGVVGGLAGQRRAIALIGGRFGTADKGRAHLRGGGAQPQRRGDARAIHDPARRDHRQIEILHQQARQRESAQPVVMRGIIEQAAMAAGLVALRDNGIDAGIGQLFGFGQAGGRAEQDDAGLFQRRDLLFLPAARNGS